MTICGYPDNWATCSEATKSTKQQHQKQWEKIASCSAISQSFVQFMTEGSGVGCLESMQAPAIPAIGKAVQV